MNVGTDFIDGTKDLRLTNDDLRIENEKNSHSSIDISKYKLIIVPALYAASDDLLKKLNQFVKEGGHVLYTFKSGFSDENVKVRSSIQPGIINEACGISYSQFTIPQNVSLKNDPFGVGKDNKVNTWMELITPTTAKVLAYYEHPSWGNYAAITQNQFGKGVATYVGCMTNSALTEKIVKDAIQKANLWKTEQNLSFPIITKSGINQQGKTIRYIFNYSAVPQQVKYAFGNGTELLSNQTVSKDATLTLEAWGVKIIEEN
jgi:beta-galactosidase